MPRPAKPWRRGGSGPWYAKVDGQKVRLAEADATAAEAARALRAALAARDRGQPAASAARPVGELVARFLDHCESAVALEQMGPRNLRNHRQRLEVFKVVFLDHDAESLRPHEIEKWLATRKEWGPSWRNGIIASIKACFNWSRRQGLIEGSPLVELRKPGLRRREAVISAEHAHAAIAAAPSDEFRLFLRVLHSTGCRPSEAREFEAAHLDLKTSAIRFPGKTTRKTGRLRVVRVPDDLMGELRALAQDRPTGPLLRNRQGLPWSETAIEQQFARLRQKLESSKPPVPVGRTLTAGAFRHRFATDALLAGVPIATVAELLGHTSTAMVERHYGHLFDHDSHLTAALRRVRRQADAPKEEQAAPEWDRLPFT